MSAILPLRKVKPISGRNVFPPLRRTEICSKILPSQELVTSPSPPTSVYPSLVTFPSCRSRRMTPSYPPPFSTRPWSPPPAAQVGEGHRAPWSPPPAVQAGEGRPHLSTHPWSPPPAAQAGEGRQASPHLSQPIPGHLHQLHKQEKDAKLPPTSLYPSLVTSPCCTSKRWTPSCPTFLYPSLVTSPC